MKRRNDTLQYYQQQLAHPAKHQPNHTTLITTNSGTDDNKKPVFILAPTSLAIDWLKDTLALNLTRIQSQGT